MAKVNATPRPTGNLLALGDLHLSASGPESIVQAASYGSFFHFQCAMLERIADYCLTPDNAVSAVLLPGDVLDTRTSSPAVLAALGAWCQRLKDGGVSVVATLGQHDVQRGAVDTWAQTSYLAPLIACGLIELLLGGDVSKTVPVAGFGWAQPETDDLVVGEHRTKAPIAIAHASWGPKEFLGPTIKDIADLILPENLEVLVLGDIHKFVLEVIDDTFVINAGPLAPMNRREYESWRGTMGVLIQPPAEPTDEWAAQEVAFTNKKERLGFVFQGAENPRYNNSSPEADTSYASLESIAASLAARRANQADENPAVRIAEVAETHSFSTKAAERLIQTITDL